MGRHDLSYRLFFTHRRMIQDLLCDIVGEKWVHCIDFDSGERVSASFVSPRHHNRESDVVWKFRRNDGKEPVYVYVLLEFQSRPDPSMPVRLMSYVSLFYQGLLADQPTAAWQGLPPVIPIVVYNGEGPWTVATDLASLIGNLDPSAEVYKPQLRYRLVDESTYSRKELAELHSPVAELFCIEKSRDWEDVRSSVHRLRQSVASTEASLRRAFETWLHRVILPRFGLANEDVSATITLEELETMLAESIDKWNRQIREEGRKEGRKEGRREGEARVVLRQLRAKFGPLAPDLEERVASADADLLLQWSARVLTAERLADVFRD